MARKYKPLDRSHTGFTPGSRMARDGRLMPPARQRLPLPLPTPVAPTAELNPFRPTLAEVAAVPPRAIDAIAAPDLRTLPRVAPTVPAIDPTLPLPVADPRLQTLMPPAMTVRRVPQRMRRAIRNF